MFNERIVVTVTPFSGTSTPNKNGKFPVMLQLIAGKMPNRNVMDGTVAERQGIEVGKTYLMQVREQGVDKVFGTDFTFTKIKELLTGKDIQDTTENMPKPEIITVKRPEGYEGEYHRHGDAIEGSRTKRIKNGEYESTTPRDVDHKTAKDIKDGTSVNKEDKADLNKV